MGNIRQLSIVCILFLLPARAFPQSPDQAIFPGEMVHLIRKGFDVSWSEFNKRKESYNVQMVRDIVDAGFDHVRIRVNDQADESLFIHLDQQIEDCLVKGLIPIIAYQGLAAEEDPSETNKLYVIDWWKTVAERYRDYSHRLMFNIFVELSGDLGKNSALVNEWYEAITPVIRSSNPTRILIYPPIRLSNPQYLNELIIPESAGEFAMVEWHFYASGPRKIPGNSKQWMNGSEEEKQLIRDKINLALDWQEENNRLTWVGAWMAGNYNKGDDYSTQEQVDFASFMTGELDKADIPWSINAIHKFYDEYVNEWFPDKMPVRDAILDPESVVLYADCNYKGESVKLEAGTYHLDSLSFSQISSFTVPAGFQIIAHDGSYGEETGKSFIFYRTCSSGIIDAATTPFLSVVKNVSVYPVLNPCFESGSDAFWKLSLHNNASASLYNSGEADALSAGNAAKIYVNSSDALSDVVYKTDNYPIDPRDKTLVVTANIKSQYPEESVTSMTASFLNDPEQEHTIVSGDIHFSSAAYNEVYFTFRAPENYSQFNIGFLPGNSEGELFIDDIACRVIHGITLLDESITTGYTGLENKQSAPRIYPNPTNGIINVKWDIPGKSKITVFNSTGQTVHSLSLNHEHVFCGMLNLPAGIYFIQFANGMNHSTRKLIIEK